MLRSLFRPITMEPVPAISKIPDTMRKGRTTGAATGTSSRRIVTQSVTARIFSAAVGASQTREQVAAVAPVPVSSPVAKPQRPSPIARVSPSPTPQPDKLGPERSLAGSIREVLPDSLDVVGVGGREWRILPAAGALIRLNGKPARLDTLHAGDTLVILGQAQLGPGSGNRFVAHAITARRK